MGAGAGFIALRLFWLVPHVFSGGCLIGSGHLELHS